MASDNSGGARMAMVGQTGALAADGLEPGAINVSTQGVQGCDAAANRSVSWVRDFLRAVGDMRHAGRNVPRKWESGIVWVLVLDAEKGAAGESELLAVGKGLAWMGGGVKL